MRENVEPAFIYPIAFCRCFPKSSRTASPACNKTKLRLTVSALLEFNAEGVRTDRRFARSVIRVDRRFTYEQAYEAMKNPGKKIDDLREEIHALLGQMLQLAMILRKRRRAAGRWN